MLCPIIKGKYLPVKFTRAIALIFCNCIIFISLINGKKSFIINFIISLDIMKIFPIIEHYYPIIKVEIINITCSLKKII